MMRKDGRSQPEPPPDPFHTRPTPVTDPLAGFSDQARMQLLGIPAWRRKFMPRRKP